MAYSEDAYKDPEVLRELYHGEQMTLAEVGDELGMAFTTIQKWMDKHDIPRREYGPLEQRFELYYEKGDSDDDCWEWQNVLDEWGYGQIFDEGKQRRAHRVSYELHNGEIPDDAYICHTCHNESCVNPNHLYAGDPQSNVDDAIERGTFMETRPQGSQVGTSKLTEEEVREIKRRYENGDAIQRELAEEFDMGQTQISRIVRGERWAWVDVEGGEEKDGPQ